MSKFLAPFNINIYDAVKAYSELEEIDWTIRTKMNVNDEVYFYCSTPVKKIVMKGIVTKIDVGFDEMIDDRKFYTNEKRIKVNNGVKYKRIKILEVYTDDKSELLTLDILRANGLKGNLQCAMMLDKNKELYDYINKVDSDIK